ncbi:hypothetical protein Pfo_028501 [Paulownia fortunei]|nr:hypothetical protein Pfo_028501 [Paulownia fortunei]
MAHKQLLQELLKEDQEPFHLKSYIADRRSQLKNPSPQPLYSSKNASPSSMKPPQTAPLSANMLVFSRSRTRQTLKDRSKNKRRAIGDDLKVSGKNVTELEEKLEETIRISCSCSNRRLSSANWTENNEDKSLDFGASTSSCGSECSEEINGDFALSETRFCPSPFRFSLHKSPSSSGRRTPDFCSPAASPTRHVNQEKENHESRNSDNAQGEEEEEKEQCSPVSVLDPPFQDDGRESGDAEEDDYDRECSYENVQTAFVQAPKFEELAKLDPIELERKLMEGSDDEDEGEREESEGDEPLSLYRKQSVETFVSQVFNQSSLKYHSRNMSTDMKRLVSDLIVEEKMVMGRICNRLDSWKEVEFDTIDMMIGLDFKREFDGWTKFHEEVEETAAEIELAVYGLLVEELSEELFYMDGQHQELDYVSNECT